MSGGKRCRSQQSVTASYDRTSPVTRSCSPLRGRAPAIHELRARVLTIMGALSACGGSILEIVLSGWAEGSLLIRRWACVRSFSFIYSNIFPSFSVVVVAVESPLLLCSVMKMTIMMIITVLMIIPYLFIIFFYRSQTNDTIDFTITQHKPTHLNIKLIYSNQQFAQLFLVLAYATADLLP